MVGKSRKVSRSDEEGEGEENSDTRVGRRGVVEGGDVAIRS